MTAVEAWTEEGTLDRNDLRMVISHALPDLPVEGEKVLLVIPDNTRTCPLGMVLEEINKALKPKVAKLDMLIALGTHAPLPMETIYGYLGFDAQRHREEFSKTEIFNHYFDDPAHLTTLGTITKNVMASLTCGMLSQPEEVTINKLVLNYDRLIVIGPVFPHEVMGFSGGNKYFFPGIAGRKIIDAFHWLGALITNREIIGTKITPVRDVVDYCASMLKIPRYAFCLVNSRGVLHGIFAGTPEEAYSPAADLAAKTHIRWCPGAYHTVLSICPKMYDELWVAAKCMYKMEPVVAKGGTLIIYAPHLKEISQVHGKIIRELGYHCLPYFTAQWDKFKHYPGGVVAHSTHVRGSGSYENGVETCNVNVVLASQISKETCASINLGYMDPNTIKVEDYQNREDEGVLAVPHAGEVLHKLESERPAQ